MTAPFVTSPSPLAPRHSARYDVERLRADFPILSTTVRGKPLVYLDNAATSQKPRSVIEAETRYYEEQNANIHRGVHYLSEQATIAYDGVRAAVQRYLNAEHAHEIIFTRGTTDGINLVASSFGRAFMKPGDEILITGMEHHSNIVPWQLLAEQKGISLRVAPITDEGELDLEQLESMIGERTRLLSVVHLSNSLGTLNPVERIIRLAHARGVPVLLDGAQSAAHLSVDVRALDCDFYVCSGHKMYGPTGIGVLYGKTELLERMPPYQGGGDMISSVTFDCTTYAPLPSKFEAGTPHVAGVVGLGAAVRYVEEVGRPAIEDHERDLLEYATERLAAVEGVRLIGTARKRAGVVGFVMDGVHPHDIGTILDTEGVAVRAGHHCAQPVMQRLGVSATARASFALYSTRSEIDALVDGLEVVRSVFAGGSHE